MHALFGGELVVVETEDDHQIGVLDMSPDGVLRLRSGFRGHPHVINTDDLVAIVLATDHPLVEP